MGANVTVMGLNPGMGGLKESLAKFKKHHGEVGDALMNISGVGLATPVDKDEPRPEYKHLDWPKMLYHADGAELIVMSTEDQKEALKKGFRLDPYPRPQVAVLDAATEKKALMDQNRQQQAIISQQAELLEKIAVRVQALENGAK